MKKLLAILSIFITLSALAQPTDYAAYYPFNGNANDESGNGNNGTVNGAILTTDRFRNDNLAYSFDGIDDDIDLSSDQFQFDAATSFTLNFWVKVNVVNSGVMFYSRTGTSGGYYQVALNSEGRFKFEVSDGTSTFAKSDDAPLGNLTTDLWYMVTGVVDRSTDEIKMYINGAPFDATFPVSIAGLGSLSFDTQKVGSWTEGTDTFFNGSIDDVSVFGRVLTETEIKELHQEGAFVFTWQINNDATTLPTFPGETYDYRMSIDLEGTSVSKETGDANIGVPFDGLATISIIGKFPRIYFNDGNEGQNVDRIKSIEQWGAVQWTSMENSFNGPDLVINATDAPNLSNVTSLVAMFANNNAMSSPDLNHWDVSGIQDMNSAFFRANLMTPLIDQWNVSAVTNMSSMFEGTELFNSPIGGWDVSSVQNMAFLFHFALDFNQDLSDWDVSSATTMEDMFTGAETFDQDLGDWDISSVSNLGTAFLSNSALSSDNYDKLLTGWATLSDNETMIPFSLTLGATGIEYCEGVNARQELDDTYTWTINDAGQNCVDLVAFYPFNGDATDQSGNGNNGVVNGATLVPDRFGNANGAYSFDGVDDYIAVSQALLSETNVNSGDGSISVWYHVEDGDEGYIITINDTQSTSFTGLFATGEIATAQNRAFNFGSSFPINSASYQDGWHYAVITYSGGTTSLYLDGIFSGSETGYTVSSFDETIIGADQNTGGNDNSTTVQESFFSSVIDEIKVYNRALSAQEISDNYELEKFPLQEGLVAYYPFNDNQLDESGSGNNGQSTGGTSVPDRLGNDNAAFQFDGIDDFITVPDDNSLDLTLFTLSGWMYLNEAVPDGGFYNMFFKGEAGDPANSNYAFSVNSDQNLSMFYEYDAGTNVSITGSTSINIGEWYLFSTTFDGLELKLYINGVEEASISQTNLPGTNDAPVFIGTNTSGTSFVNGILDDLRMFNRALTASEVLELYNLEKKPPLASGQLAFYEFTGNTNDGSGNGNDATASSVALSPDRFGNVDEAYSFSGDGVISSNDLGVQPSAITLAAWFNYPTGGGDATHQIMEINGSSAIAILENQIQTVLNLNGNFVTPFTAVTPDVWHLATLTYDGTTMTSYIDGDAYSEITNTDGVAYFNPQTIINIGNANGSESFFTGSIDDVRFYDRALTAGEVEELFLLGDWTNLTSFSFAEQTGPASINQEDRSITIEVAHGANVHSLIPEFTTLSAFKVAIGETQVISGSTEIDFTDQVRLDILLDGSDEIVSSYQVNVSQNHPNAIDFEKITTTPLTNNLYWDVGSAWADVNNDNFPDVFINRWDFSDPTTFSNGLYLNDQSGGFTDVSDRLPIENWATANAIDFDDDGDIDIIGPAESNIWDAAANKLFLVNNGNASSFNRADLTVPSSLASGAQLVWNSGWADFDNDGDLDVLHLLENGNRINRFFINDGDGSFTEDNSLSISSTAGGSLDIAWPDIDNDNDADLFIANNVQGDINDELYVNNGDGTFIKVTSGDIVSDNSATEGTSWGDLNNDGFIDGVVVGADTALVYMNNGDGTFFASNNAITEGTTNAIGTALGDYDNDGDLDVFVTSNDNSVINRLWENDGNANFAEVTGTLINEVAASWGASWTDYDRDGYLDLFVANANQKSYLYRNTLSSGNYLGIRLNGIESNKNGFGARIVVKAEIGGATTGEVSQMRQVLSTSGSRSQQESLVHFGLGAAPIVENITVYWPSGRVNSINSINPNQFITIEENNGLIAYYPYDGDASDASNNNLVGIEEGGVSLTSDRFGNANRAYGFDGVDDRIVSVNLPQPSLITVAGWFSTSADYSDGYANVIDIPGALGLGIGTTNELSGIILIGEGDFVPINASNVVNDGIWHHAALSYDGANLKLYLDGAVVANIPEGAGGVFYSQESQVLNIGYSTDGTDRWFNGSIDEVRIYDRALTEAELLQVYEAERPSNLLANYPFNGNANDESGNGIDGTVSGATLTTDRLGESDMAYSFDGVDDFISLGEVDFVGGESMITIAWWQDIASVESGDVLSFGNFRARISSGFVTITPNIDGSPNIGTTITQNEWEHFVFTYDGSNPRLYKNGSQVDVVAVSGTFNESSQTAYIGTFQNTNQYLSGSLDEIKIYARTLSAAEVLALYNEERPPSDADAFITSFKVPNQTGNEIIDDLGETIELFVSSETDVTSITPTITFTGSSISPESGVAQDFTNTVSYTVTAADLTTTKSYDVTITNATGLAPTQINLSAGSIAENSAVGTVIGILSTVDPDDPDGNDTYSYEVRGAAADSFAIQNMNQLISSELFDYELQTSYSVTIRSTDPNGLFYDEELTIGVTNVNPQASDLELTNSSIVEGASDGTTIGTVSVVGDEAKSSFTFRLLDGSSTGFTMDGNALKLDNLTGGGGTYSVIIQATDDPAAGSSITPDQVQNTFTIEVVAVDASSSLGNGNTVLDYRITGMPTQSVQVSSAFPSLASADRLTGWRIVSYSNGNFSDLSTSSNMTAGRGYWFLSTVSTSVDPGPLTPILQPEVTVQLNSGWNLISNPFLESLDFSEVITYNIDQGVISDTDLSSLFAYNENIITSLSVFQGGWIENTTGSSISLRVPNPSSVVSTGRISNERNALHSWVDDRENWQLILHLQSKNRSSNLGAVGMRTGSTEGEDYGDLSAPPLIAPEASFRIIEETGLIRNFKPYKPAQTWKYSVIAPSNEQLILSWDANVVASLNDRLYIYDPEHNASYNMAAIQSIEVGSGSSFEVLFGEAVDKTTIQVPVIVYPNPAIDEVYIRFFVEGEDEEINSKLTIFGMDGREIMKLEQVFAPNSEAIFEINELGLSAGTYFIEVKYGNRKSQAQKLIVK